MYCDSCILVKLLTPEKDSAFFERELRGRPLSTSDLAFTEVCSALLAKERAGRLVPEERDRAWRLFQYWTDNQFLLLHPLNATTLRKAARVLQRCHPDLALRSLDAIHVATADLCQDLPLASTDLRVRQAAEVLGLEVFPDQVEDRP